jgi:hypothetical protein
MHILIAVLFMTMGLLGVFWPGFYYRSGLLSPPQIMRNKRIFNRLGVVLIILGVILVVLNFVVE